MTLTAKKMTRKRAITASGQWSVVSGQWSVVSGQCSVLRSVGVVQVVLQDDRGGNGVELATLAQATHVAALCSRNVFSLTRGKAFIPHLDRHTQNALGNAREVLCAAG